MLIIPGCVKIIELLVQQFTHLLVNKYVANLVV